MSKFNKLYESTVSRTLVRESVEGIELNSEFYSQIGIDKDDISNIKGEVSDPEGSLSINLLGGTSIEVNWQTYDDGTLEVECFAEIPNKTYKFYVEKSEMGEGTPISWKDGVYQASTICEAYKELAKITQELKAQ